MDPFRFD